jgi:hypothetical protein
MLRLIRGPPEDFRLKFRHGPQWYELPLYNCRWVAAQQHHGQQGEEEPMNSTRHSDPAERSALMRLFYRNWRPTRLGRWVNRFACWWSGLGLPPRFQAVLEVRGRTSGSRRSNPVVIATVEGKRYLVSVLGPGSDWVRNVEAAKWRRRYPPGTPTPRSPRGSAAGAKSTNPPRVRANRVERSTALPAYRQRAAVRLGGGRRALSRVPDRSLMKATCPDNSGLPTESPASWT